jgi:hypothetical protein
VRTHTSRHVRAHDTQFAHAAITVTQAHASSLVAQMRARTRQHTDARAHAHATTRYRTKTHACSRDIRTPAHVLARPRVRSHGYGELQCSDHAGGTRCCMPCGGPSGIYTATCRVACCLRCKSHGRASMSRWLTASKRSGARWWQRNSTVSMCTHDLRIAG